jgi:hypothetical protein
MSDSKENNVPQFSYAMLGIGMLALLVLCFLGLNYLFRGSTIYSLVISMVGAVLIIGILMLLLSFKKKEANKGMRPGEIALLVLYLLLAIASFFPLSHFANVELQYKEQIREDGLNKLNELTEMTDAYKETVDDRIFKIGLEIDNIIGEFEAGGKMSSFINDIKKYGIDPGNGTRSQMVRRAKERKKTVLGGYKDHAYRDFDKIIEENQQIIDEYRPVFKTWQRPKLNDALTEPEKRLLESDRLLQEMYTSKNEDETAWNEETFSFERSPAIDHVLDQWNTLRTTYQPNMLLPVILFLLTHFFILSPYLFLKRFGIRRSYLKEDSGRGTKV